MNNGRKFDAKMIAVLAMFSAISFILAMLIRIPLVPAVGFLTYEPKDVVFVIAGFLYGPVAPLAMAVVLSLIEGFTITSPVGIPMNFISSVSFACIASLIYMKKKTIVGATVGLTVGVILTTIVMLLWNYALSPILLGFPREAIVSVLLPGYLPFNLIKYTLNASIALLLYKPIRVALDRSRLLPIQSASVARSSRLSVGIMLASVFIILTCVIVVLAWREII